MSHDVTAIGSIRGFRRRGLLTAFALGWLAATALGAQVSAFDIRHPFYRKPVVLAFAGLAFLGLIWSIHRWRLRRVEQRNRELESLSEQLAVKNAEAATRGAEMERFAYSVSHDLKAPLVTIQGFLGLLARDLEEGKPERVRDDLERLRGAAGKMQRLLDDILELSRIGKVVATAQTLHLRAVVDDAVELLAGAIGNHGAEIVVQNALPRVFGDRPRLVQVFQNLIDNAIKYRSGQAPPRIEIGVVKGVGENETDEIRRLDVAAPPQDRLIQSIVYVRDNGLGLAVRDRERVFKLFDQLDPSREGSGLGLALVQRIIDAHGGKIWVESDGPGHGSTFFFTLPTIADQD